MRIGQFTDSFPPIINGVSAFVAEHHAELSSQGHDAHVFTFGYTHTRDSHKHVWRTAGVPIGLSPFRANVALNTAARRAAQQLDVYHAHEAFGIGQVGAWVAQRLKKPIIFTNHTRHDLYILNYPRLVQPAMRWLAFGQIAHFMRASVLSTAPSEETAQLLRRLAPDVADRVRVVRNGIRLDHFDRTTDCASRTALDIPCDATVFTYVGRLTPEKNLSTFADAMLQAVRDGADAHWVVIGDGICRDELVGQLQPINNRVHFLGIIPRDQVPRYLAMADVFATPSLSEVNPVSVIEALASGKPYVGLRSAWWNEFDVESNNGAPPPGVLADDPRHLTQAIHALSDDAAKRSGMSVAAKRLSHRFDIRDITTQWIEIYHGAMHNAIIGDD
jgi:glycosyltransferase involved in cell wall biosynthesis